MRLRTTYRQPDAARYREPGGAWDVPTLDDLLSSPRMSTGLAVVDGEVSIDAGTLEQLVSRTAGGLRGLGVRRGDVVAWQLPNWWEAVVLFRACWRCGAVAAPIHHQVGATEVARMLDDLDPAVSLSTPGQPLAGLVDTIAVRRGDALFDGLLGGQPVTPVSARGSDVAVVLCSSGSTGYRKAVLHTDRGLASAPRYMARSPGLTTA